jgi:hypothetical protein
MSVAADSIRSLNLSDKTCGNAAFSICGGYTYVSDPLNELLSAYIGTFVGIGDTYCRREWINHDPVSGVYGWSWFGLVAVPGAVFDAAYYR